MNLSDGLNLNKEKDKYTCNVNNEYTIVKYNKANKTF